MLIDYSHVLQEIEVSKIQHGAVKLLELDLCEILIAGEVRVGSDDLPTAKEVLDKIVSFGRIKCHVESEPANKQIIAESDTPTKQTNK